MYYAKHLLLALIPGILLGLAGFSFLQTTGILDGKSPQSLRAYVITSGSMEPTIPVGSVIVNQTADKYAVGDIITFTTTADSESNVTHRIVGVTSEGYVTKGDANQDPDPITIPHSQIHGKSTMHIPHIGYLVNFSKTPQGFVALIVIPATIVIYEELKTIFKEIKKVFASVFKKKKSDTNNRKSYWRAAVVMPIIGLVFIATALSTAYFSDVSNSVHNILGVATTYVTSSPTSTPAPSSTPTPTINHIVINEFMPNPASGNEWVEIYNPTDSPVDLTGWSLKDLVNTAKPLNVTSIPAQGYIVFEDGAAWLNNSSEETISLLDNENNVIDSYTYDGTVSGLSIGRNVDGSGVFVPCLAVSPGSTNNNICAISP